jgi:hypothetical protein
LLLVWKFGEIGINIIRCRLEGIEKLVVAAVKNYVLLGVAHVE